MDFSSSSFTRYASLLAFVLALLVACGAALSQEGNTGPSRYSGASGAVKPQTIDDATLKRTAKAFVKVRRIAASAQQEISCANSDQQKQRIAAQAESDKVDAVKAAGLQPQQYNQL